MRHSIMLLSENYALAGNNQLDDTAAGIGYALLVDGADEQKIHAAYQNFSEQKTNKFTLVISLNSLLPDTTIQYITAFLFLPNYITASNRISIAIMAKDALISNDTEERLQASSGRQGIENLVINLITDYSQYVNDTVPENQSSILFNKMEDLLRYYRYSLQNTQTGSKYFYLYEPNQDLQSLYKMIMAFETELNIKQPALYMLATENLSLRDENELLKKKYSAVSNELNNYKLHLETLRSSHQAKEIQAYYDEAYEILPLWYKRFGHLIKVIMGKRSVRSLFTDNNKKNLH